MNKKILSIIFTLFLAGLLSISCSNKDKTGPGDNGGGSSSGLPTVTTDGEGVGSSYRQYKYAPTTDSPFTLTGNNAQNLTSANDFQLSRSSKDANLQGKYEGGILVKMPLLKTLGFTSDLIRILPENIVHTAYGYDIHTLYVLNNTEEKLEYIELKGEKIKIATFLEMDEVGVTLTKITKEKDKEAVTETYNLKGRVKFSESSTSVTPIEGTPIDPSYK